MIEIISTEPAFGILEVAGRLKVGEATGRGWIKEGELRVIELGKGWRTADLLGRDARIRRESGA